MLSVTLVSLKILKENLKEIKFAIQNKFKENINLIRRNDTKAKFSIQPGNVFRRFYSVILNSKFKQ